MVAAIDGAMMSSRPEMTAQAIQSQQKAQAVEQAVHEEAVVLREAAAELENISSTFNKRLQFVVDHSSNDVIVKVIDKETDKVIRELPPEEMQRLHSKLKETIGLLFDEFV